MRRRRDKAHVARHPVNANIQETANDGAKDESRKGPEVEWDGGPDLGIKIAAHEAERSSTTDAYIPIRTGRMSV